jgi:hypothetical protein
MVPPSDPIIGTGGLLGRAPHPGQAALILLDALQPFGVSTLYLDESGLVGPMGTVAKIEPLAAVQVLRGEGLLFVGTVVAPLGTGQPGKKALTIRSIDATPDINVVVRFGELYVLPGPGGQEPAPGTRLELSPVHNLDLGRGRGKRIQLAYEPGAVGLIVDARGRPLTMDEPLSVLRERVDGWLYAMTGERGA